MQEQRAKLVTSDNTDQKYAILLDQEIGRGAFGVVYRAVDLNNKQDKLVVKVVALDGDRREMIERELHILQELPPHPNLVRVKPIKCYSENNYYIMMEYCRDGTLLDEIKQKRTFSEQEVVETFYQMIKGYKVLFDKKILHQDLKPQNVLIDKGIYKLADFGLSIFYEGYKFTNKRQGTLNYIAPQKLMKLDYKGNPLSDVYSMGVIFYQLAVGRHPYIRTQGKKDLKIFLQEIKQSKLSLPVGFSNNHSLKFLELFDLILRMLAKTEAERVPFEEIWRYVQTSENFENARKAQRQQQKQHTMNDFNLVVSEVSKVLTIPITTPQSEQLQIRQKLLTQKKQQRQQSDNKTAKLLSSYILDRRIVIYFLDRLARRLIVQQLKIGKRTALYDNVIFQLLLLTRTVVNEVIQETRNPKRFTLVDWKKLKVNNQHRVLLEIVARDQGYIEDATCDFLAEDSMLSKKELKDMFQVYKENDIKAQLKLLRESIIKLMAEKSIFIQAHILQLGTIVYLSQAQKIILDLPAAIEQASRLQSLIHQIQTSTLNQLRQKVQQICDQHGFQTMIEIADTQEQPESARFLKLQ